MVDPVVLVSGIAAGLFLVGAAYQVWREGRRIDAMMDRMDEWLNEKIDETEDEILTVLGQRLKERR